MRNPKFKGNQTELRKERTGGHSAGWKEDKELQFTLRGLQGCED